MNPELSIIDSISKVPHSIDDVIWVLCKNYKDNCYLPQILPFDGPAIMDFVTNNLTGGTFKIDLQKSSPEVIEFDAGGTIIQVTITPLIKLLKPEFREDLAEKDRINHSPNTPFSYILDEIPKKQLNFKFEFKHSGNSVTFLEYMPQLTGLAAILSNIILEQNHYYQGNLDLAFHPNYSHSCKKLWIVLVNNLKELRVNNDWNFKYPKLMVNKNVKSNKFYSHGDFSLTKQQ
jgi:hypothetical protein